MKRKYVIGIFTRIIQGNRYVKNASNGITT